MSFRLTALSLSLWCSGLLCGCSAQTTPADSTAQQARNVPIVEVPGPEPKAATPEPEEPEPEPEPEPEEPPPPPRARQDRVPPEPELEEPPPPPPPPMYGKPTSGAAVAGGTPKHRPGAMVARGPATRGPLVGPNMTKSPRLKMRPKCSFPAQAQQAGVDKATVVLRVRVDKDGHPKSVRLVKDPGYGFGSTAVGCMLKSRFAPARDRHGKPMAASITMQFRFQQ